MFPRIAIASTPPRATGLSGNRGFRRIHNSFGPDNVRSLRGARYGFGAARQTSGRTAKTDSAGDPDE